MNLPLAALLRQTIPAPRLIDVAAEVEGGLADLDLGQTIRPGDSVAVTAGSRGIKDMPLVLKTVVDFLRRLGARPHVSPAMGSHGGATAPGQAAVLAELDLTEAFLGAPIVSRMEVDELGRTSFGAPVLTGRDFTQADHVIVVNRVKAHTIFRGRIQSGLLKSLAIGMGKHAGAVLAHQLFFNFGFERVIDELSKIILAKVPVRAGVAIVENYKKETALVSVLRPERFLEEEPALLQKALALMPGLPFDQVDVLVVDQIGKNISGAGLDTNVIGRFLHQASPEPARQKCRRIYVRDLTEATQGNAIGVGLADFCARRLAEKIDFRKTRINCVTATGPEKGRLPLVYDSDQEAIADAVATAGVMDPARTRLVWIKNTLELEYLWATEPLLQDLPPGLDKVRPAEPLPFDSAGNLPFGHVHP